MLPKTTEIKTLSQLLPQPPFASSQVFQIVQRDQCKIRKDHKLVFQDRQGRICEYQYVASEDSKSVGIHQSCFQHSEQTYRSLFGLSPTLSENRNNALDFLAEETALYKFVKENFNGKGAEFWYASDIATSDLNITKHE